ncbi:MAG: N-acetyl-gamma-glutamyl-phosphate reductase [Phycisphaeraceae bacterium]
MMIRVAIVGPTSYTALYLMQVLARHPSAKLTYLASHRDEQPDIAREFPQLVGRLDADLVSKPIDPEAMADAADVVFLCVPHVAAMQYAPRLLDAGLRVIDLSADYRLRDAALYARVYDHEHTDPANLAKAVYGLPEFFAEQIAAAALVANPGCYPTAAALGIAPLLERSMVKPQGIVINAASGITGAGRAAKAHLHFPEMNESFMAYNVGTHRHQSEIEQTLGGVKGSAVSVLFVPHLLPVDRGILETIYLDPMDEDVTQEELFEAFEDAYEEQPFVRLRKDPPNIKHVRDTNYCDLSVRLCKPTSGDGPGKVVVLSAIDNMIKGASGQAVQNMNLMFELDQTAGLR